MSSPAGTRNRQEDEQAIARHDERLARQAREERDYRRVAAHRELQEIRQHWHDQCQDIINRRIDHENAYRLDLARGPHDIRAEVERLEAEYKEERHIRYAARRHECERLREERVQRMHRLCGAQSMECFRWSDETADDSAACTIIDDSDSEQEVEDR